MFRATVTMNGRTQALTLQLDGDRWRWYDEEGEDTEVSGPTVEAAIEAGKAAWRFGTFTVLGEDYNEEAASPCRDCPEKGDALDCRDCRGDDLPPLVFITVDGGNVVHVAGPRGMDLVAVITDLDNPREEDGGPHTDVQRVAGHDELDPGEFDRGARFVRDWLAQVAALDRRAHGA